MSGLPAGVFDGLTSLQDLNLGGNPVDPLPVAVSLEPAGPGRFRAVAPTAAPFALSLPVSVFNGEIDGGATTLTIPVGMVHSDSVSVTRSAGSTSAVTADIGTLPGLPSLHFGYALQKSSGLPLEVFAAEPGAPTPVCDRTVQVRDGIVAAVSGVSDCGGVSDAHLAAITSLDLYSAGITSLKEGDFDGLSALTGLRFDTNSLSELPEGVFDGLTALTYLDLDNNSLSNLPAGVFDDLTALTTLQVRANRLSGLPEGVFDGLTALTYLELSSNSLNDLPAGVFDGLTSLEDLHLDYNSLSDLPEGVFDGLSALTELRLHNNSLSNLPEGVFDGLTVVGDAPSVRQPSRSSAGGGIPGAGGAGPVQGGRSHGRAVRPHVARKRLQRRDRRRGHHAHDSRRHGPKRLGDGDPERGLRRHGGHRDAAWAALGASGLCLGEILRPAAGGLCRRAGSPDAESASAPSRCATGSWRRCRG